MCRAYGYLFLLLIVSLPGSGKVCRFSGSWRTGISAVRSSSDDVSGSGYGSIRLSLRGKPASSPSFEVAYSLTPLVSDSIGVENREVSEFRLYDLERFLYGGERYSCGIFALEQNLDRLNIGFHVALTDIIAGRQAIYWGVSKAVSPTDFIAPYPFNEVYTEYRRGVDGIRVLIPVGTMSEIDAGWLFGRNGHLSRDGSWIRGRMYIAETDVMLLAGEFRENLMVGASVNRSIGGATAWLECAWTRTGQFLDDSLNRETYLALSAGADYSINGNPYGFIEYHLNTAGTNNWEEYADELSTQAYETGGIYLLGVHYLCPGIVVQVSPLLSLSGRGLVNLFDPSSFIMLRGEYSVAEDVVLESGVSWGTGSAMSEFGSYPDQAYAAVGLYF
jgi:hypothetical protein